MLISTIKFDIFDYSTQRFENDFVIPNTVENWELVAAHHFTRNIRFEQEIENLKMNWLNMPIEFIHFSVWIMLMETQPELFADYVNAE